MKETVIYALPKGETRDYMEQMISCRCKTAADIERVKAAASADGWHSFRVATIDLSKRPDFGATVNVR